MRLTRLVLERFRNYREMRFEPGPGLNVLVGENGQGKSNLLEAMTVVVTGKSFRAARERELVMHGESTTTIEAEAALLRGTVRLRCTIDAAPHGRKRLALNDEPVRFARYLGAVHSVSFVPGDVLLVGGPPAMRRRFLNGALAPLEPAYYAELARLTRIVMQKNALLRDPAALDVRMLDVYDEQLASSGAVVTTARSRYVRELDLRAREAFASWNEGEARELRLRYVSAIEPSDDVDRTRERLGAAIARERPRERARGVALVGPQRDDLAIDLDGRALGTFGSQGQQRAAVLALKIAEYRIARDRVDDAPILVLDDVLSELDARRQAAFLAGVGEFDQAFVTATHAIAAPATTYVVRDATVLPC